MTTLETLELCERTLRNLPDGRRPGPQSTEVYAAVKAAREAIAQEKRTVIEIIEYVGEWQSCADGQKRLRPNDEIILWLGRTYLGYE